MTSALAGPILLVLAQTAAPAASAATPYRVGSGDVLEVTVRDHPELSRLPTVQTTGAVFLPSVGPVAVAGLTTGEIAERIAAQFETAQRPAPHVSVQVKEYQSQFVWVRGEVFRPGRKPLREGTRLIDALLDAGGLTARASGEVLVERRSGTFGDGGTTARFTFDGGDPSPEETENLGLPLASGDVIFVAIQHWVSVGGEVARPGRYPMGEGMTLSRLIESAGGITRFGSQKVTLQRGDAGAGAPIEADLKAIESGRAEDLVLAPGDQVVVPARRL